METVKEKFLNMIDNELERMYQETRYRHMNDLEYGRYCALNEMRTWCDEMFDGVTIATDKNELIDWLKGEKYTCVDENSQEMTEEFENQHKWELSRNCFINKVIKHLEDATDTNVGDKWISVNDRLPDKTGKYIVCTAKNAVYCSKYYANGKHFGTDMNTHITHWMPLPKGVK